uniref:Eukaryotic translation initiation factor 3 subunit M n=1 Tax=Globisporangium ultimum (strain ATCC 200006 / CBS 805.95 / DAOM BR144) TaxID=431595 RepID=K3WBJ5_GLOUD
MAPIAGTATDLVAYVNTLLEQSLDLSAEIKKGDHAAVVAAVAPKVDALLAHDAETDVEGTFSMLFDVLRQLPAADAAAEAKKVLAAVTAKQDEKALLRLRIATSLFNKSVALPELRFDALIAVITFASKTDNVELVASYFDDVESLFAAKSLSPEKRRQLFLTIADVLQASDATSLKVLLFLEKYLTTFAAGDKDVASGKAVAVRTAKLVLQQPVASFIARIDLLANPVVAALKGDKLYELLEIVSTKALAEYLAFYKSAGDAFFKDNGLDAAQLEATMRLFTLSTLPTGFNEIAYAVVAKALVIKEDEVEQWVVKAITSNVVSAKIDQLKRTVVISRTLQRGFGAVEWKEIDVKLQVYKKNVGALLEVVRSARQAHQK